MIEKISLKAVSTITYALIIFLMLMTTIILGGLPWIIKSIVTVDIGSGYQPIIASPGLYRYFLFFLYTAGVLAFLILNDLRRLFKSCLLEQIFVKENVSLLLRMAILTFLITVLFLTKVFVVNSLMTMAVSFVFFMASVFCLVLTLLFDRAVQYKLENDLTI
ncbi:DUF2975 domain-containing protein [Clostridia bacterium]|nr:DUF2975 domain-containing protein [Clostridia bacterium]